jgi:hypothetical protein
MDNQGYKMINTYLISKLEPKKWKEHGEKYDLKILLQ